MLAKKRREEIKEIIIKKKAVKVSELCKLFQVSSETIRRDLKFLEEQGLVERYYGGSILKENISISPIFKYTKEEDIEDRDLEKIALKAIEEIREGETILLDASPAAYQIACTINSKNIKRLTIITNGLNIATELAINPHINLLVTSGNLESTDYYSLIGPDTVKYLDIYNVDIAFLSTRGISVKRGLTTSNIFEAEVKKSMVKSAEKVIIMADSSKFGKDALVPFCSIKNVNKIITSGIQNNKIIEELKNYVDIIIL